MVTIEPLTELAVARVALSMRPADEREIFATRWAYDPLGVARQIAQFATIGFVACLDRAPVAVVAAMPVAPTVLSVGMFATEDWPKVALSTTRFARQLIRAAVSEGQIHRAECRSIEGHHTAHRWLEMLGAVREAPLPDMGRNRETFFLYAWRRKDFEP